MKFLNKKYLKSYRTVDSLKLIHSGEEYFDTLKEIINKARKTIHLQVYIFSDDVVGRKVAALLKSAAERGVEVFVIVDTIGSFSLPDSFIEDLKKTGIHFRFFHPLISSSGFHFGRRMHHKVVTVDGEFALVGGINIAERYMSSENAPAWLDFAVLIKGDMVRGISDICERLWKRKFTRNVLVKQGRSLLNSDTDKTLVRVRENDWMRKKFAISKSYKQSFNRAENYITIVGAYFMPSLRLRHLIKKAAKRGVKVRVILSQFSDARIFRKASIYLYSWLLRQGVEVYEYKKSVVHAKIAVVDDIWTTIGSHDLNFLSTYGLIEMNIDILDKNFTASFNHELEGIMQNDCIQILKDDYSKNKSLIEKITEWLAYQAMRFSLWTLVFITSKK